MGATLDGRDGIFYLYRGLFILNNTKMEMDSITAASLMSFFMKSSREIHMLTYYEH